MDMDVNENRQKRARAVGDEIGLRLGILMYFRYKRKQIKKKKRKKIVKTHKIYVTNSSYNIFTITKLNFV